MITVLGYGSVFNSFYAEVQVVYKSLNLFCKYVGKVRRNRSSRLETIFFNNNWNQNVGFQMIQNGNYSIVSSMKVVKLLDANTIQLEVKFMYIVVNGNKLLEVIL